MNLNQTIRRSVLIAIALVLERVDKKITAEQDRIELTQKPIEQPLTPNLSKYTRSRYKPNQQPIRPYMIHVNPNTGIITSTTATSKYTPEQLQAFYKINPYTNL